MLKRLFRKIAPAPKLVHIPVGCPPLQHYPGYLPQDTELVSLCVRAGGNKEDHYIDGFGVRTDFTRTLVTPLISMAKDCSCLCLMMAFMLKA